MDIFWYLIHGLVEILRCLRRAVMFVQWLKRVFLLTETRTSVEMILSILWFQLTHHVLDEPAFAEPLSLVEAVVLQVILVIFQIESLVEREGWSHA